MGNEQNKDQSLVWIRSSTRDRLKVVKAFYNISMMDVVEIAAKIYVSLCGLIPSDELRTINEIRDKGELRTFLLQRLSGELRA